MDRVEKKSLENIFHKISPKELIGSEIQSGKLIYNVVGFVPSCDFVENTLLITNLGYLLTKNELNVCIIDLKVFYPNMHHYLDMEPHKKGDGLMKILKNDKIDIRDEIQSTSIERLFVLEASPQDLLEEYYDFEFKHIERLIHSVKTLFDVVLIDIPNNPPLEFCLGAMKYCHIGFFTATERTEVLENMLKLLAHADSLDISPSKFANVIFMNLHDFSFDYKGLTQAGFKIIAAFPFVKSAISCTLDGKIYIKDDHLINKHFKKEISKLVDFLIKDK